MSVVSLLRFIAGHPVNSGRPLAALARFARWQVGSLLLGCQVVHEWVGGCRFLVKRGETGLTGNIYNGLHEFADMAFVLHFVRPGDWFFDVGANVGSYTLLACSVRGARGVAVEPIPDTFRRLVDNLRLNRLDERVEAINCGLGAEEGLLRFSAGEDTMNHALAPGESAAGAVEMPVSKLDTLTLGRVPALIKIDVEGFETQVLRGAHATLAMPGLKAVIMELNGSGRRYGFDESLLLRQMGEAGFRSYTYVPATRRLVDLGGKNLEAGNTLFVRDADFVAARLRDAETFAVLGRRF
jgi:FkbM family methyltransferase